MAVTNLAQYYQSIGQALPSVSARASAYEKAGLGSAASYQGSASQNTALLNYLTKGSAGAGTPATPPATTGAPTTPETPAPPTDFSASFLGALDTLNKTLEESKGAIETPEAATKRIEAEKEAANKGITAQTEQSKVEVAQKKEETLAKIQEAKNLIPGLTAVPMSAIKSINKSITDAQNTYTNAIANLEIAEQQAIQTNDTNAINAITQAKKDYYTAMTNIVSNQISAFSQAYTVEKDRQARVDQINQDVATLALKYPGAGIVVGQDDISTATAKAMPSAQSDKEKEELKSNLEIASIQADIAYKKSQTGSSGTVNVGGADIPFTSLPDSYKSAVLDQQTYASEHNGQMMPLSYFLKPSGSDLTTGEVEILGNDTLANGYTDSSGNKISIYDSNGNLNFSALNSSLGLEGYKVSDINKIDNQIRDSYSSAKLNVESIVRTVISSGYKFTEDSTGKSVNVVTKEQMINLLKSPSFMGSGNDLSWMPSGVLESIVSSNWVSPLSGTNTSGLSGWIGSLGGGVSLGKMQTGGSISTPKSEGVVLGTQMKTPTKGVKLGK